MAFQLYGALAPISRTHDPSATTKHRAGASYVVRATFNANWREFSAGIPKKMTGTRLRAAIDCDGFVNTALIPAGINSIAAQNPRICPANMLEANKSRARKRASRGGEERLFALLRPFEPAPAGRRTWRLNSWRASPILQRSGPVERPVRCMTGRTTSEPDSP